MRPNLKPRALRLTITLLVTTMLVLSLTACQAAPATTTKDTRTYVTSLYPMYVAALNLTSGIAGVEVVNMTGTITGCLHDYQLSPGELTTIETADAFIYNGADLESYLDQGHRQLPGSAADQCQCRNRTARCKPPCLGFGQPDDPPGRDHCPRDGRAGSGQSRGLSC